MPPVRLKQLAHHARLEGQYGRILTDAGRPAFGGGVEH